MLAITECCQPLSLEAAPGIFQHSETIYRNAGVLFGCDVLRFFSTADDTPRTLSKDAMPENFGVIWGFLDTRRHSVSNSVWSDAGAGTEVQLTVPAAVAYEKSRDGAIQAIPKGEDS
jgi:hypothetical protein